MIASLALLRATLWLGLFSNVVQSQSCTTEQAADDSCNSTLNGICDANGVACPVGSDCLDCDPCLAQSFTDCTTCTASTDSNGNPCAWCPHWDITKTFCLSLDVAVAYSSECDISPGFVTTCPDCTVGYDDQVFCNLSFNRICDVGESVFYGSSKIEGRCGVDTDCMDCDPCHEYDATDCETCTANGCSWCSKDGACWSPNLVRTIQDTPMENPDNPIQGRTIEIFSCEPQDIVTDTAQCATLGADNYFSDPLYEANTWVFDAINVTAAWEAGFSEYRTAIKEHFSGSYLASQFALFPL